MPSVLPPLPTIKVHSPIRGKLRRLLVATMTIAALLAVAPLAIALTPLRHLLVRRALPDLKGSATVGRVALGWFEPLTLFDVEIRDSTGKSVVRAPKIASAKTLLGLLTNSLELGSWHLSEPEVHVISGGGTSNFEQTFAALLERKSDRHLLDHIALDGQAIQLEIVDGTLVVEDLDSQKSYKFDPVDFKLALPRNRRTFSEVELHVKRADGELGQLDAELSLQLKEIPGSKPRKQAEGQIHWENLPVAALEPWVRRLDPSYQLSGQSAGTINCVWALEEGLEPVFTLVGYVGAKQLDVAAPALGQDRLRLAQVELPLQFSVKQGDVQFQQAELKCDLGNIALVGVVDPSQTVGKILSRPGYRITGDLDLARLAEMLPHLLHVQADTKITAGKVNVQLQTTPRQDGVAWQGSFKTASLQAVSRGQQVVWRNPLNVEFTVAQLPRKLPIFESIRCDSGFLKVDVTGTGDRLTATAIYDLAKLTDELSRFVDLGNHQFTGQGWSRLILLRDPQGNFTLDSDSKIEQLRLVSPSGKTWQEDLLTWRANATGKTLREGVHQVDTGYLRFHSSHEDVELRLIKPMANLLAGDWERVQLAVNGDLARWQGRLRPWLALPPAWEFAGMGYLTAELHSAADAVNVENFTLAARNLHFKGPGLVGDEAGLDIKTASARWSKADKQLEFRDLQCTCPTIALNFPTLKIGRTAAGMPRLVGSGAVLGDVSRLQRLWRDPVGNVETIGGALSGQLHLVPVDEQLAGQVDFTLQNVVLGPPNNPRWREPLVRLTSRGFYDPDTDRVQVDQLKVDSPTLAFSATGKIANVHAGRDLALAGHLTYDLQRFEPLLRPYLGQGVRVVGRDTRPFHVEGSLARSAAPAVAKVGPAQPAAGVWGNLTGETTFTWQSLEAYGAKCGPTTVPVRLAGGWLNFPTIEGALNDGRLRLQPGIRLDPSPADLFLGKGPAIERARITPAMCAGALGYAMPALANVLEAEGQVSVALDSARIPLTNPGKADVSGRITLHDARIGGGPFIRALAVLLKEPSEARLARESVVPFHLVEGRVHHKDMTLVFPDLTIRTSGSVGLDGSLNMVVESSIPPRWTGGARLGTALAKQTIKIPLVGTLAQPRLDEQALRAATLKFSQDTATDLLKQELEKRLKKDKE